MASGLEVAATKYLSAKAGLAAIDLITTKVLIGTMALGAGAVVIVGAGLGIRGIWRACRRR